MFAIELLSTLPSIGMRGAIGWIELAVHGAVGTLGAVAGRMIRLGTPAAPALAAIGIIARAVVAIQSLFWTRLPTDVAPGTRGVFTALACVNAAIWLGVVIWTRPREQRIVTLPPSARSSRPPPPTPATHAPRRRSRWAACARSR